MLEEEIENGEQKRCLVINYGRILTSMLLFGGDGVNVMCVKSSINDILEFFFLFPYNSYNTF